MTLIDDLSYYLYALTNAELQIDWLFSSYSFDVCLHPSGSPDTVDESCYDGCGCCCFVDYDYDNGVVGCCDTSREDESFGIGSVVDYGYDIVVDDDAGIVVVDGDVVVDDVGCKVAF